MLNSFDKSWFWGLCRMGTLQSLNACLLIGADHVNSLFMKTVGALVELTNLLNLSIKLLGIVSSLIVQPVAGSMRFEIRLILKNARHCSFSSSFLSASVSASLAWLHLLRHSLTALRLVPSLCAICSLRRSDTALSIILARSTSPCALCRQLVISRRTPRCFSLTSGHER